MTRSRICSNRQVVRVVSGRVIDEIAPVILGRAPKAVDGTWLWEVYPDGSERLIPIATTNTARSIELENGLEDWHSDEEIAWKSLI